MPILNKARHPARARIGPESSNQGRTNPNRDVYDTARHRKLRKLYLQQNPLCAHCRQQGILTPATVFDHIVPINQGGDPWADDNKQGLCRHHHNKKSARERHQSGKTL